MLITKIKNYLGNIGICENDMENLDTDDLCELAIHTLCPYDLSDFFEMVNA